MTEDSFIDIESPRGQAALIAQTHAAIDGIGAVSATSPDGLVKVWVAVSGTVVDIDLDEATRRLDCDDLARLITATAQKAAQNAAAKVAEALAELEHRQARLLDELSQVDPDVASALRDVAIKTQPRTAPAGDPFDLFRHHAQEPSDNDDW